MPPIIILDSDDDEDHGYSPPLSPQAPISPARGEPTGTHSSGPVSRATTSTDPSFFQNIYDEQNGAACGYAPDEVPEPHDRDQLSSSEMTAPAPFKRTVTGLVEPSSLMSSIDLAAAKSRNAPDGNNQNEWTQASTPGRKKAPTAVMDDPWDVPSSPDNTKRVTKIRIKRRDPPSAPSTASKATQDSLGEHSRRHRAVGYKEPEGSLSGRRKRRKIESSEPSQQGSNEVDLVTIPFSHDNEEARPEPTPSMLPPTLPVNDDVSFYISAKPLTDTQKLEHQSVHLPSSDNYSQPMPPIYQFDLQNIGSSGSATNLNTPRSDGTCLMSTAPLPSNVMAQTRTAAGRFAPQRWDSSPDVISAVEPPPREDEGTQRGRPRDKNPPDPMADELLEAENPVQLEVPAEEPPKAKDLEPDYVEQPVKAKKGRGRPKKKANGEATQSTGEPPSHPVDAEQVKKPKKKRGRPRKSEQTAAAVEDNRPQEEKMPVENDALGAEEAAQPVTKPEEPADVKKRVKGHKKPIERQDLPIQTSDPDDLVLKETSPNAVTKDDPSMEAEDALKPAESTTSVEEKEEKEEKAAVVSKGTTPTRGLSALLNKPVYRVGLSKRSRIAPLLKCLRK